MESNRHTGMRNAHKILEVKETHGKKNLNGEVKANMV
jgi:hypothetical protein